MMCNVLCIVQNNHCLSWIIKIKNEDKGKRTTVHDKQENHKDFKSIFTHLIHKNILNLRIGCTKSQMRRDIIIVHLTKGINKNTKNIHSSNKTAIITTKDIIQLSLKSLSTTSKKNTFSWMILFHPIILLVIVADFFTTVLSKSVQFSK